MAAKRNRVTRAPKTGKGAQGRVQGKKVQAAEPQGDILDMEQAIQLLKTTRPTFYRWLRQGKIKGMKVGRQWRFQRRDVERFMAGEEPVIGLTADIRPLIEDLKNRLETLGLEDEQGEDPAQDGGDGVIKAVSLILRLGIGMRASDIHMAPLQEGAVETTTGAIRYRVDGVLQEPLRFDHRLLAPLVVRWKIMFAGDINERVRPQDGRILLNVFGRRIDLRVSTLPEVQGESITVRVLDQHAVMVGLDRIDYSDRDREKVMKALHAPHGLIVVSGPTGSGKTTNLYACINHVAGQERKTITIEDPVEYLLPWTNQVPLRPAQGFGYNQAIRALLRHDPDVLMIGEIRNGEAFEAAQEAALTGHLVLTTMHADTAASVLTRMADMGAVPFVIASSVTLVTAQRLVRRICTECREESILDESSAEFLERAIESKGVSHGMRDAVFFRGKGCAKCSQTGYRGRTVISEVLEMTSAIRTALQRGAGTDELQAVAAGEGMSTMLLDGLGKAAKGVTTVEEVFRVVGHL